MLSTEKLGRTDAERISKHDEIENALGRLENAVDRLQIFCGQLEGGGDAKAEAESPRIVPTLCNVLTNTPGEIDRHVVRIDEIIAHMREILY